MSYTDPACAGAVTCATPPTLTLLRRYIPGLGVDRRAAMIEVGTGGASDEIFVYHENRLGHVIAMADSTGALTDKYVYTPFGVQAPLATSGNPFGGDLIHWIKS